jgi:hypothetical protein
MEYDAMEKQYLAHSNWRAHIANYVELKRQRKSNNSIDHYCKQQKIDCEAFKAWLKHIEKEDKYVFHVSFATAYLNCAQRSLDLLKKHMKTSELCMPLIRDSIVAYAVPFSNNDGRLTNNKCRLHESFIPASLKVIHEKICHHRDKIVAHSDLAPRNPRVGTIGIQLKGAGYYWTDYQKLIPEFGKLIIAVQKNLNKYNQETFTPKKIYFQDPINSPKCADEDPGPPC